MRNESIALSIKFFEEVKGFEKKNGKIIAPSDYKKRVIQFFDELIEGGMTVSEISEVMERYKKEHEKASEVYSPQEMFKFLNVNIKRGKVKEDPNNLIKRGKFYYHPELQVTPPPPVLRENRDGTFSYVDEKTEFYLEIREKYTLEDLTNYFYKTMNLPKNEMSFKRDMGAFKHMLETMDLDLILYTIDEALFLSIDTNKRHPKVAFDIRDYIGEGEEILSARKAICYEGGLNRVIPRKV